VEEGEKTMLISETDIGRRYIDQFNKKDQEIAKKLIDNLIIISEKEFLDGLTEQLDKIRDNTENLPIVLYPAFETKKEKKKETKKKKNIPFFQDDGNPQMPSPQHVGSEGILQKFCRDYSKSHSDIFFNLSLNKLRKRKIKTIVCVDDIIASGNRMKEFIEWIYENKTIKSWHSFKWIKFLSLTYGVTERGLKNILKHLNIIKDEQIKFNLKLDSGRSFWSSKDRDEIKELCYNYGDRYKIPENWILGFNKTFSIIIFPHSVPNTTPGIIWWGNNQRWKPLFPRNVFPTQIIDLTKLNLYKEEDFLKKLGLDNNTFNFDDFFRNLKNDSKRLFLFLLCLSKKKRKLSIISEIMELPITYVEKLRDKCIEYHWITTELILTKQGRNVLKSIKKYMKNLQENICIKEEFYYPISLRGLTALSSKSTSLENGGSNDC